jgi:hypothetical protein
MDDFLYGFLAFFLGAILCFILVASPIAIRSKYLNEEVKKLKKEAIERNYAEHDSSTGEWQWVINESVK